MTWAAVILTGGTSSRLGGVDKASLEHAGRTLLASALDAVADADEVVVVGPTASAPPGVRFVREEPPGGGPLAGIAAGASSLAPGHDLLVVLAVDMPHVTRATVDRLREAASAPGVDGAWLTDATGRRQLAGVVVPALVPEPAAAWGTPVRRLMEAGRTRDVPGVEHESEDVDTWGDATRLGVDPRRT